jgi:uncharacterized protein (TIGR00369 family)
MATAAPFNTAGDGRQSPSTCFACGADNPSGLHLTFHVESDGKATSEWVPGPQWQGWHGILHGGIVSTLLDEAMAQAVAAQGFRAVTGEMRVRFRESAPTGERLKVQGWVAKDKRRLIETEASLTAADGSECAHAWAVFVPRATAPR